MQKIKINYEKENYELIANKIINVLEILEKKKIAQQNEKEILKLMQKYKLFNITFLKNINKL
ncbi:MAG: hypothetical protein IJ003_00710 [Candidatus Gastranaerophilales bacterium]|nr:hypothetical protein [Candidatus Gastranaerophilales bacterium]